jgi:hypothetical protein
VRQPAKFCVVRTGVLWGVLLTLAAWSHAQTAVRARLLLDDKAMAHCAVYVVDIERRGSDTRGALVAELPNGWRAVYPMDLAANSRKRLYLPVPSDNRARRFRHAELLWRGADGERVRVELPTPLQTHLPIVFVGNRVGGWERLNEARAPFVSAFAKDHEGFSPPMHAYYLRPAVLPDDWRGLLGLPVLVLVDGAEALTDAQWQAVRQWLAAGGTLVVSAGSFGAAVNLLPLADLVPRLSLSDAPVRPVTPPRAPPDQPVRLMRPETLQDYGILLGDARAPVMLYRRVGAGNLYLFLGDLGDPVWRAWDELPTLMGWVVSSSGFLTERWGSTLAPPRKRQPVVQVRRVWAGVWLLGGYFVAVWVLAAWLRRRRRLASVAAPLTGLTLLTSIGAIAFAPRARLYAPIAHGFLYVATDMLAFETMLLDGVVGAGEHTIRLPEGALVLPVGTGTPLEVWHASDAPEVRLRAGSWTEVQVVCLRLTREFPQVEARREGNAVHLHNRSPNDLYTVWLRAHKDGRSQPSRPFWERGKLYAGQSVHVPLDERTSEELIFAAGWWRNTASEVVWNGAPVQEVNRLFVWVR